MLALLLGSVGVPVGTGRELFVGQLAKSTTVSLRGFTIHVSIRVFFTKLATVAAHALTFFIQHFRADPLLSRYFNFVGPGQDA